MLILINILVLIMNILISIRGIIFNDNFTILLGGIGIGITFANIMILVISKLNERDRSL